MYAEALEIVMLTFEMMVGILLIRGNTFIFSIGTVMVWQERGSRGKFAVEQ